MNIIVNADDYGFDRNRTEAIRACFNNGLLTQTTAMVNMPYCSRAVGLAREDGFEGKIGLHLNLTFGVPLTDAICKCKSFVTDGRFNGDFHRSKVKRFLLSHRERVAVSDEVRAQMERYVSYKLALMHLDSHHHVHTDPSIQTIVLPLAREFGFRSVRISRNFPTAIGFQKRLYKGYVNRRFCASGLCCTDFFGAAQALGELNGHSVGVLELGTHPLYLSGPDMDLNMEHDVCEGVLSDTHMPVAELLTEMRRFPRSAFCDYSFLQR